MTTYTKLRLDIICNKLAQKDPVYRLYLDNVLIIERIFWPEAPIYRIQEHITMEDDDHQHHIKLKNVFPHLGDIGIHAVSFIDGDDQENIDIFCTFTPGENEFTFKLRKR